MEPGKYLQVCSALLWANIAHGRDHSAAGRIPCWLNRMRNKQISAAASAVPCDSWQSHTSGCYLKSSHRLEIVLSNSVEPRQAQWIFICVYVNAYPERGRASKSESQYSKWLSFYLCRKDVDLP